MRAEIVLPDLGLTPIRLSVWFAEPGEFVYIGDRLVEVLAAGVTFDVPAPATGRLAERHALPDDLLSAGQILGAIDISPE